MMKCGETSSNNKKSPLQNDELCEIPSKIEVDNIRNEAIPGGFLQKWNLTSGLTASYQCVLWFFHPICLKYPAVAKLKIWCSKMQHISGNQCPPDLLTCLMKMSLVLCLPHKMHFCRSSSNFKRPTRTINFETATRPSHFGSLVARCRIHCACHDKGQFNVQKWSEPGVFWHFDFPQPRAFLRRSTSKGAPTMKCFEHFGLDMWWQNTVFRDFSTCSRKLTFFLNTDSLFSDSSHHCCYICPYVEVWLLNFLRPIVDVQVASFEVQRGHMFLVFDGTEWLGYNNQIFMLDKFYHSDGDTKYRKRKSSDFFGACQALFPVAAWKAEELSCRWSDVDLWARADWTQIWWKRPQGRKHHEEMVLPIQEEMANSTWTDDWARVHE